MTSDAQRIPIDEQNTLPEKHLSLPIHAYAFAWRIPPVRVALRLFGMDYNRFMMRLLHAQRNFDESIVFEVERQFWFGAMKLDLAKPTQRSLYFEHEYEKQNVKLLREHLKPGSTFIDIGAHVGYHSLIASHLVGNTGRVICFEPNKESFKRLQMHLELNNAGNIAARNLAVSDKDAEAEFFVNPFNDGGHSLESFHGYQPLRRTQVRSINLDDFLQKEFSGLPVSFIKIDVEGHQLNVLNGMTETINKWRPKMIIEVGENDPGRNDTFRFLEEAGYNCIWIGAMDYLFMNRRDS